jgi:L-cysteine S-thiosulfotransferase
MNRSINMQRKSKQSQGQRRQSLVFGLLMWLASATANGQDENQTGRVIAHDRNKGNCLACHSMPTDPKAITSADIGPPLIGMKERYPDRQRLRGVIWNAMDFFPDTVMPPFGKNKVLTEEELDRVVEYIYGL